MRTLIAEDDTTSSSVLVAALKKFGECMQVQDGMSAVEAFGQALDEEKPFDLVCMDIMMPNMDGIQAVKALRAAEQARGVPPDKEVKVLMVTALNDPRTVIQSFYRAGANAYLVKPMEPADLKAKLAELDLPPSAD